MRFAASLLPVVLFACHRAPDALAGERAQCEALAAQGQLRAGLSVAQCTAQLKQANDLADPGRRAEELVDRVAALVARGHAAPKDGALRLELNDALSALQQLGRPAVAPALARMGASGDPELRIALAKVLVATCSEDCLTNKFECIVPALLEGTSDDKPSDVRREAEKGLTHCTGQQLGDDAAAWRGWWAAQANAAAASVAGTR